MVPKVNCNMIDKAQIGSSLTGKTPCELCAMIQRLGKLVGQARKDVRPHLAVVADYEAMKRSYLDLKESHHRCAGCGLCFAGRHIAKPINVKGIGDVCQWCAKDIRKIGVETFKTQLGLQEPLDKKQGNGTRGQDATVRVSRDEGGDSPRK